MFPNVTAPSSAPNADFVSGVTLINKIMVVIIMKIIVKHFFSYSFFFHLQNNQKFITLTNDFTVRGDNGERMEGWTL